MFARRPHRFAPTRIAAALAALSWAACGYYTDRDGDGYYLATEFEGSRLYDCDDQDALRGAGAPFYLDADGDLLGDGATACYVCVDTSQQLTARSTEVNPPGCTGTWVYNALDCRDSGDDAAAWGEGLWMYRDADADGFGDPALELAEYACTDEVEVLEDRGYVNNAWDCDDGVADVAVPSRQFYYDADSDGFGGGFYVRSCSDAAVAPAGYVDRSADCDDARPDTFPGAPDCDTGNREGHDESCDGLIDEDAGRTWYRDDDGDGWGVSVAGGQTCPASTNGDPSCTTVCPGGDDAVSYVRQTGDCDDDDPAVYPGNGC